jgi:DNA invertase Pin-like site-specific DNA recombinase
VAIYTRLSDDQSGTSTGIERQREACLDYARAHAWTVTEQYSDSDLSAFRRGVTRPEMERMLEDAALGRFDLVLVWKLDRLVRRIAEFGRVWSVFDASSVALASVKDSFDTSTTVGLIIVQILVGVAQMESENISTRARAKHAELRRLGKWSGGGSRAFGLTDDWTAIVPEEAQEIRAAAARIIAGQSVRTITSDWRERGVVGASGKPMTPPTIRRMLLSRRLIGEREEGGAGGFPAIIDPSTFAKVQARLRDPSRRLQESTSRKHLLSGFLYCGLCGARLYPHPDKRRRNALSYVCTRTTGGCGKMSVVGAPLEAMMQEGVLGVVDGPELAAVLSSSGEDDSGDSDLLRQDEEALADLSRSRYVDRSISDGEYQAARVPLVARIAQTKHRLERRASYSIVQVATGHAREAWEAGDLHWRRSLLGAVLERVVIHPPTKRPAFDPQRVEPIFRF